jgi:hypothetical protein
MGRTACTEPQCLYSRAIPVLPLWAIRPVQSLSACTVELYFYSPYGPYGLYRASVPVQGCTFILYYSVDKCNIYLLLPFPNISQDLLPVFMIMVKRHGFLCCTHTLHISRKQSFCFLPFMVLGFCPAR